MNEPEGKPNRYRPPWTDFLKDDEKREILKAISRAKELDAERRQLTAFINLARQRASQRRLFKEKCDKCEDTGLIRQNDETLALFRLRA